MKQADDKKIYTVSEVNYFAKQTLEQMTFWVEGEVQTIKKNPDWTFYYLDLKDERAILSCIVNKYLLEGFNNDSVGQKILAYGNLTLYEPTGKYQFRIYRIEKAGEGYLAAKLAELIAKLKAEGLFDAKYKKPIPAYPKKVCLVTSAGSDAANDFKRHTVDKFPIIELYTADVRVQGPRSISQLLKVIPNVDKMDFDVIVITRGGGSLEDLAAFNDEQVGREIFKMKTPVIVAIGHEANESLAEWISDRRASTPTDAANIVTAGYMQILQKLEGLKYKLRSKANFYFSTNLQRIDHLHFRLQQAKVIFKDLPQKLQTIKEILRRHEKRLIIDASTAASNLKSQLVYATKQFTAALDQRLEHLGRNLSLLSPDKTLGRGYSLTFDQSGRLIRSIDTVVIGSIIGVKLADGKLKSQVKSKSKNDQRFW